MRIWFKNSTIDKVLECVSDFLWVHNFCSVVLYGKCEPFIDLNYYSSCLRCLLITTGLDWVNITGPCAPQRKLKKARKKILWVL